MLVINVVFYLLDFAFISSAVYSWLKYDGMNSDESAAGKTGRLHRFFPVQYYVLYYSSVYSIYSIQ